MSNIESLYSIEQNIKTILTDIEDNDGEITDEQYNKLVIHEENLKQKLNSYLKAIQVWKGDAESCKAEKKRINEVQKKYENRVERLKGYMLKAVQEFGTEGKNNKYIELTNARLFTKSTKSVEINEARIKVLIETFESFIHELVFNDTLACGKDVDIEGILASINANVLAEHPNYEPYTIHDFCNINLEVRVKTNFVDLLSDKEELLKLYADNNTEIHIINDSSKEDFNRAISIVEKQVPNGITLAKVCNNQSLNIR